MHCGSIPERACKIAAEKRRLFHGKVMAPFAGCRAPHLFL
jgi:hypothetical protein